MNSLDLDALLRKVLEEDAPEAPPPAMTAPPVTTLVTAPFTDTEAQREVVLPAIKFPEFTAGDIGETLDIRNFATMARVRMRKWSAVVKDRKTAQDVAASKGANLEAYSVYKRLLAGVDEKRQKICKIIDAARMRHYEMTLPWSTTGVDENGRRDGPRLLPNTLFMEYVTLMGRAKVEMAASLSEFRDAYPTLIEAAKRSQGTGFDETQYPTIEDVESRFALDFNFDPIPLGVDFKGLPAQQIEALRSKLEANIRTCMENALQDVWLRLDEAIRKMAEVLSQPEKGFHDTLVGNMRETVKLAEHLNATKDARLIEVVKRAKRDLCVVEADDLRKDLSKRAFTAQAAIDLLHHMEKY